MLWHDSQELEQLTCTGDDVQDWLDLDDDEAIVDALVEAGFLGPAIPQQHGSPRYEIRGNEKHIENLRSKREAARENGKHGGRPKDPQIKLPLPRGDNNQKRTDVGYSDKPTSETQPNQPDNHSSLQFSAVQFSARERENAHAPEELRSGLEQCKKAWVATLQRLGVPRTSVLASEEIEIVRACQRLGDPKIVALALFGAGYEPADERFDPRKQVSIARVLTKDKQGRERIDRFVNFGVKAQEQERQRRASRDQVEATTKKVEEEVEYADPATVRAFMDRLFGPRPEKTEVSA